VLGWHVGIVLTSSFLLFLLARGYDLLQPNSARKKGFKKGVDADDSRRRRTETTFQIRKEKKEDQIAKRRGVRGVSFAPLSSLSPCALFTVSFVSHPTLPHPHPH
jgi:hypothetical protein